VQKGRAGLEHQYAVSSSLLYRRQSNLSFSRFPTTISREASCPADEVRGTRNDTEGEDERS
jgi:hypothetical protein